MKGQKRTYHVNVNQEKSKVTILISNRVGFRTRNITKITKRCNIIIKGLIHQESMMIDQWENWGAEKMTELGFKPRSLLLQKAPKPAPYSQCGNSRCKHLLQRDPEGHTSGVAPKNHSWSLPSRRFQSQRGNKPRWPGPSSVRGKQILQHVQREQPASPLWGELPSPLQKLGVERGRTRELPPWAEYHPRPAATALSWSTGGRGRAERWGWWGSLSADGIDHEE